ITIGLIGKRDFLDDCIKSVKESLFHAAVTGCNAELAVKKIDAENLERVQDIASELSGLDGILIPGNMGNRGFLGLLSAVKFAREKNIPYLGIDLGMQLMAIETARNLAKWEDADSTEFIQNTTHPVVSLPEEQAGLSTASLMKLGASDVKLEKGSKINSVYKKSVISERHRNKYTFDPRYKDALEELGLTVSATCPADGQVEAFEWKDHPWGIGVQFHPEFVSRPTKPHPLFTAFIAAAAERKK
ncbi:MAG: gamma-glutamyl-gamma-aminobutyrate hydrolase family protein, partial [Treponemataceae bacterium]|nr:gamma-glutamyl-gamma-aminobutyrate hydrolase family protein [Treponemataceae bacterium]